MDGTHDKVLLVEDDKIAQMAFKRLVREENLPYDYAIAGSVAEARSALASGGFDVVIVDYLLGDGTAFDLFDLFRGIPTIFATGAGNEELAVRAMKAGAHDYLIKSGTGSYLKVLPEIIKNAISRKRAEEELKRYHENLEELVEERAAQLAAERELLSVTLASMGDGVVVVNRDRRVVLLNSVAEKLMAAKLDTAKDRSVDEVFQLISEQAGVPVESPIDQLLRSGNERTRVCRGILVAADGSKHLVSATATPLREEDGAVTGVVMVLRDLTDEMEIDRLKTDFVSSVSHELRTPLTAIKACAATILRDFSMPDDRKRNFLRVINEETDRLTSLVNDLLEISQLEHGTMKIVRESVDVAPLVKRILCESKPVTDNKNILLECSVGDDLPSVLGDEKKIQSAISNLVSNAIKFTPEGGNVCVCGRQQGEELVLQVSDTGVGIPKEELPKVFERFYRVHRPGQQIQGTGLGLAIVKEVISMHGGRVEVESEPGKGTTFTVSFALAAEPSAPDLASGCSSSLMVEAAGAPPEQADHAG